MHICVTQPQWLKDFEYVFAVDDIDKMVEDDIVVLWELKQTTHISIQYTYMQQHKHYHFVEIIVQTGRRDPPPPSPFFFMMSRHESWLIVA